MVEKIVQNRPTEVVVSRFENKFEGMTTAKDMEGWIKGRISKFGRNGNIEYQKVFEGILSAYRHFHPEVKLQVEVDSWKGKSSFDIIDQVDSIIAVKYQKMDKGEKPKQMNTLIYKIEMQYLIDSILFLDSKSDGEPIKSKFLAMNFSSRAGLGHDGWRQGKNPFFADRIWHNKFTIMLDILDKLDMIKYSKGTITILNKKTTLQEALENFLKRKVDEVKK